MAGLYWGCLTLATWIIQSWPKSSPCEVFCGQVCGPGWVGCTSKLCDTSIIVSWKMKECPLAKERVHSPCEIVTPGSRCWPRMEIPANSDTYRATKQMGMIPRLLAMTTFQLGLNQIIMEHLTIETLTYTVTCHRKTEKKKIIPIPM